MPSHDDMVAAVETYVRGFAENDPEMICGLFAEDAVLEDPFGTPPHVGLDAVRRFYRRIMDEGGARLELIGPVRTAADCAAFTFSSYLTRGGVSRRIDPIDIFEFDAAGKVRRMRAYWSGANVSEV
jgi:steroid delta-isomerase